MSAIQATRRQVKELVDGTLRLTVDISPAERAQFWSLFPEIDAPIALAPLVYKPETKEPNDLARKLHVDGYFRNPTFWLAMHDAGIYTLQQHKKWIEARRCAVHFPGCAAQVCLHHTDQAGDKVGGKRQPENPQKGLHFYGLPVCHEAHTWLHGKDCTREDKYKWRTEAIALTASQMKEAMKAHLGIDSLKRLTPEMLSDFEREIGFL